jgi:hypothetical protein
MIRSICEYLPGNGRCTSGWILELQFDQCPPQDMHGPVMPENK